MTRLLGREKKLAVVMGQARREAKEPNSSLNPTVSVKTINQIFKPLLFTLKNNNNKISAALHLRMDGKKQVQQLTQLKYV